MWKIMEKKPKCEKRWRSATHKECQVVRSNKKFRKDIVQYDLQILIHKYTNSEKFFRDIWHTLFISTASLSEEEWRGFWVVILDEWKMNNLARMKNKQHQLFNYKFARIVWKWQSRWETMTLVKIHGAQPLEWSGVAVMGLRITEIHNSSIQRPGPPSLFSEAIMPPTWLRNRAADRKGKLGWFSFVFAI